MARTKPNFPDEEDQQEAPETPGEQPDAEDLSEGPETEGDQESPQEDQAEGPDAEQQEGEAGSVPGADQLSPEDTAKVKRIALAAQAMISDPKYTQSLVAMAKGGATGIVEAAEAVLDAISKKGRIDRSFIVQAGAVVLTVLLDFLVSIKAAQPDPKMFTQLLGMLIARVAKKYGVPAQQVAQMVAQSPSGNRPAMNAGMARGGMLGQMMQRAGVPGGA